MIDIIDYIKTTLSPLGIPVVFNGLPTGSKTPSQYITFLEYLSGAELEAADKEITTERLIQVNVWSKINYSQLVSDVRTLLEQVGFERISDYDAAYQDGDSHFNRVLRFKFIDEY
ncbi:hypothetical protein [Niallia sp. Krafla_26]|uniref:hypothetical protein n=1 Tax=Niallia sp. Krafla_26 TaxID=3064703 RepID=UPI003D177386